MHLETVKYVPKQAVENNNYKTWNGIKNYFFLPPENDLTFWRTEIEVNTI